MRKFTADYILNGEGKLVSNHILVVDDNGTIIDLVQGTDQDAEIHEGILTPGFINTHCHLELSHLQNKIPQHTSLHGFIKNFVKARLNYTGDVSQSIDSADTAMWEAGIQGIGDICNTDDTFLVKKNSQIRYHSFIELFSLRDETSQEVIDSGNKLLNQALVLQLRASLVPHSPYSVPPELFKYIKNFYHENNLPWCIHNQETESENTMFRKASGALYEGFLSMGFDMKWFSSGEKNSLIAISDYFPDKNNLLFVHNTFTSQEDINFLKSSGNFDRSWFCICAKANIYIENRIPDILMLHNQGCKISIGTDSLASNDTLSVLEELKTIHQNVPSISVETLLKWATVDGADYFNWQDLGKFSKGCKPGIIQITNADPEQLNPTSNVNRLV